MQEPLETEACICAKEEAHRKIEFEEATGEQEANKKELEEERNATCKARIMLGLEFKTEPLPLVNHFSVSPALLQIRAEPPAISSDSDNDEDVDTQTEEILLEKQDGDKDLDGGEVAESDENQDEDPRGTPV